MARIDLQALRENFALSRELVGPKTSLLCVVKANGYGHGAVRVARTLEDAGAVGFAVASPEEGIELREGGIRSSILLFGGPFTASGEDLRRHQLTPVLYEVAQVGRLEAGLQGELPVHLKIDTGMTRLGVLPAELPRMLQALAAAPKLKLQGVLSHLAQADLSYEGPTAEQCARFAAEVQELRRIRPEVKIYHLGLSSAILEGKGSDYDWARPGIMLYGANPNPRFEAGRRLKPVMSLETEIVSLKTVPAGTAVSYGGTWTAARPSRIAVLPIGYADGYHRALSNRGQVLLHGRRAPVAGRVCMDFTMADVTDIPEAKLGDKVRLWGPELRAEEVAEWAGTISYELFCSVGARVPRVYQG
ncbi:MAG TPA: alanine racemase [bacterium]|nr:alanine racemase [bacterium]